MASAASYASLIARATSTDSDDPTLIYDIADKVKSGGVDGAIEVVTAIQECLTSSESDVRLRVLNVLDTLVIECGSDLHKAIVQTGFLVTLADIHDKQIECAIPAHLALWQSEMGSSYNTVFEQAFSQRGPDASNSITLETSTLARRGVSGLGQLQLKPVSPLYPFMTIAYFRALRILEAARGLKYFHMQSIHLSRQALHLVILLNDAVDQRDGPTQDQEDERIELEDELLHLEEAIEQWSGIEPRSWEDFLKGLKEIREQYARFFKSRFYYNSPRDPESDRMYQRLVALDKKALWVKRGGQIGFLDDVDDENAKFTAYIESVHTSPTPTELKVPTVGDPLSLRLDPSSTEERASEQPFASTSATVGGNSSGDALEAARRFRKQEEEGTMGEQSFLCPVPGCGKKFQKQHLLKHHIREHDDRPYRCPIRRCDRRFTTPTEQRVHEALHRIKNMGIIPNMPDFAPPMAHVSTPSPPPEPVAQTTAIDGQAVSEKFNSEGKPGEGLPEVDVSGKLIHSSLLQEDEEERNIAEAVERSLRDQEKKLAEEMSREIAGEVSKAASGEPFSGPDASANATASNTGASPPLLPE